MTLLLLHSLWHPIQKTAFGGLAQGGAVKLIDWHSTIIRWSAVAFSLGAWAGIVVVVRHLAG